MTNSQHSEHLNTPRQVYDDQAQLRWKWDQAEPFGVNTPDESPINLGAFELPFRFPGQFADKETNLAYNYFRDYDPSLGIYKESDPIGLRGDLNTYAYVENRPLSVIDAFGLQTSDVFGGERPRGLVIGWPNVSTQAQQSLARQLQRLWNSIFNQSSPNEELDRCYEDREAQRKRDQDDCEWWWKMRGRNADDYRRCQRAADERLLKCYEDCRNTCKRK